MVWTLHLIKREQRNNENIFEMSEIKLERLNAFLVCLTHFLLWRMGGTRSPYPSSSWWRLSGVLFDVRWRTVKLVPGTGQGGQYKFCKSDELNQIVSLIFYVIKMKEMHFVQELIESHFQASYELLYSQYLSGEGGPEAGAGAGARSGPARTVDIMRAILRVEDSKTSCLLMWSQHCPCLLVAGWNNIIVCVTLS